MTIRIKFNQPFATSLLVVLLGATLILLPYAVMLMIESAEIKVTNH
jgi:hypothetical protein